MLLGFEGDEFYAKEWPSLFGNAMKDMLFLFPDAVVIGFSVPATGEVVLNPDPELVSDMCFMCAYVIRCG